MRTDEQISKLVEDNMPLAFFFAKKYSMRGGCEYFDEALSAAMDGLWAAARDHDESGPVPFGTYAAMRIKWKFSRAFLWMKTKKRGFGTFTFSLDDDSRLDGKDFHEVIAAPENTDIEDSEKPVDLAAKRKTLSSFFLGLSPQERLVTTLCFGLNGSSPKTLDEVGTVMGFSKERARQVRDSAILKMRNRMKNSR